MDIEVNDSQDALAVSEERVREAVRLVLVGEGHEDGRMSVAIIDNPTMHELNRAHLNHDYETDVLSFVLEETPREGEVIVSADYALGQAPLHGWSAVEELLLYVIHGTLHVAGYDDTTPAAAREMHAREQYYLAQLGIDPGPARRAADSASDSSDQDERFGTD